MNCLTYISSIAYIEIIFQNYLKTKSIIKANKGK